MILNNTNGASYQGAIILFVILYALMLPVITFSLIAGTLNLGLLVFP